ncbi:MAG: glycosyltransferase [Phycisphaerales bacterium]|nr:glycosyltransferase [Phycisphaerales bacterium]
MRVLMLGWEFPPFITGGLGTACAGMTKSLVAAGAEVTFVLPKSVGPESASHVRLVTPRGITEPIDHRAVAERASAAAASATASAQRTATAIANADATAAAYANALSADLATEAAKSNDGQAGAFVRVATKELGLTGDTWRAEFTERLELFRKTRFLEVPMCAPTVYASAEQPGIESIDATTISSTTHEQQILAGSPTLKEMLTWADRTGWSRERMQVLMESGAFPGLDPVEMAIQTALPEAPAREAGMQDLTADAADYSGDLLGAAARYARFCADTLGGIKFDVIHAHDWLTYPAGMALQKLTGKPLVVHVHSTEFDRSGETPNQQVYSIERRGMHAATRVISVSMLTKNVCVRRYNVPESKIDVVYNGVELRPEDVGTQPIHSKDKIVLYFGRITLQKGPEYFIRAAKRVLEYMDNVKFVVAGNGDQASHMIEMAAALGIGHKVLFTGFLRGRDISRVFSMADLYVMPSVSEPFGIAPLEAMSHNVPVLISKTSGVSEVLVHALKADFWDIDDMADKIIAVLRHPILSDTLKEHGSFEVRGISWDGTATKCLQTYTRAIAERFGTPKA